MKKFLFLFFLFLNTSFGAYNFGYLNLCVDDYYSNSGIFYFQRSDDLTWYSLSTNYDYIGSIHSGYVYDSSTGNCSLDSTKFGMSVGQYNFILALSGSLVGFVFFFFSIYIVLGRAKS